MCFFWEMWKKSVVEQIHIHSPLLIYILLHLWYISFILYWINRLNSIIIFTIYVNHLICFIIFLCSGYFFSEMNYFPHNCTLFNSWFLLYSKYTILIKVKKKTINPKPRFRQSIFKSKFNSESDTEFDVEARCYCMPASCTQFQH